MPRAATVARRRLATARRVHAAQHDAADYGADGLATLARPFTVVPIEAVARGSVRTGLVVNVRRVTNVSLHDRMAAAGQLSDVQHLAADRLVRLHAQTGLEPHVSAAYAPRGWNHDHDDDSPELAACSEFRQVMRGRPAVEAAVLHGLCLGQHPGGRWLIVLQAALDELAARWGLE